MAGTPGKNKIEKGFKILVDVSGGTPRDLCGDLVPGSISGGGITLDEVDMTGVCNAVYNFLAGHGTSEISANFHMNDTATTGAFTVLTAANGYVGTITLQYGSLGNAPDTGDPEWEGEYCYFVGQVENDGGKFVIPVTFKPSGAVAPAWGTVA